MRPDRRALLKQFALAGAAVAAARPRHAFGQDYPSRPLRFIVTVSAGGGADAAARLIGTKLNAMWNQPVVVENRLGATGMIGAEIVAKSPADGYTALFASTSFVQAPALFPNAPYDIARDFAPVSQVTRLAVALVVAANSPFHSLDDYLAAARNPGQSVNYGSIGIGSSMHVYGETLARDARAALVHVPYKGEAPTLTDVVGGHLDSSFVSVASSAPLIASGKLRALAVIGRERSPVLPNVPTMVELGFPRLDLLGWYGVLLPAGTPKPIVDKLSADIRAAAKQPEFTTAMRDGGNTAVGSTPDEFAATLSGDFKKWTELVREANIKPGP
jgi:tripartite-type tricarboxylate transporter receptor subunit TctC